VDKAVRTCIRRDKESVDRHGNLVDIQFTSVFPVELTMTADFSLERHGPGWKS
jgi:hypothetical protein